MVANHSKSWTENPELGTVAILLRWSAMQTFQSTSRTRPHGTPFVHVVALIVPRTLARNATSFSAKSCLTSLLETGTWWKQQHQIGKPSSHRPSAKLQGSKEFRQVTSCTVPSAEQRCPQKVFCKLFGSETFGTKISATKWCVFSEICRNVLHLLFRMFMIWWKKTWGNIHNWCKKCRLCHHIVALPWWLGPLVAKSIHSQPPGRCRIDAPKCRGAEIDTLPHREVSMVVQMSHFFFDTFL